MPGINTAVFILFISTSGIVFKILYLDPAALFANSPTLYSKFPFFTLFTSTYSDRKMQLTITTLSIFLGLTAAIPGQTYRSSSQIPPVTYTATAILPYSTVVTQASVPTTYYPHTSIGEDCGECGGECGDGIFLPSLSPSHK